MRKKDCKLKNDWLPYKLIYSTLFVCVLLSCRTTQKKFSSKDASSVVRWNYVSLKETSPTLTSYIYRKNEDLLRMDIVIPFYGSLVSFILNGKKMIVKNKKNKTFYEGVFDSRVFLPSFDSFPPSWLFALLKGEPLPSWKCFKKTSHKMRCQMKGFIAEWTYKKSQWQNFSLQNPTGEKIEGRLSRRSQKKLKRDIFTLSVEGYRRQKNLSFE